MLEVTVLFEAGLQIGRELTLFLLRGLTVGGLHIVEGDRGFDVEFLADFWLFNSFGQVCVALNFSLLDLEDLEIDFGQIETLLAFRYMELDPAELVEDGETWDCPQILQRHRAKCLVGWLSEIVWQRSLRDLSCRWSLLGRTRLVVAHA